MHVIARLPISIVLPENQIMLLMVIVINESSMLLGMRYFHIAYDIAEQYYIPRNITCTILSKVPNHIHSCKYVYNFHGNSENYSYV